MLLALAEGNSRNDTGTEAVLMRSIPRRSRYVGTGQPKLAIPR
jgi:hypothetical protein